MKVGGKGRFAKGFTIRVFAECRLKGLIETVQRSWSLTLEGERQSALGHF